VIEGVRGWKPNCVAKQYAIIDRTVSRVNSDIWTAVKPM
jgi:hypothetical protein